MNQNGMMKLATAILISFKDEEPDRIIRFAKSGWAKFICDSIGLDYVAYRNWAIEKGRALDSPR